MTSSNLDLVRSIYAAWERGDFGSADWADPEIEFVLAGGPDNETTTGLQAMAASWRRALSIWEDYRLEADEFIELDDERVLVLVRFGGRGKTSGLQAGALGERGAALFYVRNGRVTRLIGYLNSDRAMAELGLA
jgi:ketosteroid isomerase-like protein